MRTIRFDLVVSSRVLVYREATADYIAHALELDVIGTGNSPNKAMKDLENAIQAQISFCAQKDCMESLFFAAPKEYVERWLSAANKGIQDLVSGDVAMGLDCFATVICIPEKMVRQLIQKAGGFVKQQDTACATA
jgi:hypothetical protein